MVAAGLHNAHFDSADAAIMEQFRRTHSVDKQLRIIRFNRYATAKLQIANNQLLLVFVIGHKVGCAEHFRRNMRHVEALFDDELFGPLHIVAAHVDIDHNGLCRFLINRIVLTVNRLDMANQFFFAKLAAKNFFRCLMRGCAFIGKHGRRVWNASGEANASGAVDPTFRRTRLELPSVSAL